MAHITLDQWQRGIEVNIRALFENNAGSTAAIGKLVSLLDNEQRAQFLKWVKQEAELEGNPGRMYAVQLGNALIDGNPFDPQPAAQDFSNRMDAVVKAGQRLL